MGLINNRIWHSLILCFISGGSKRANYLQRKHIFGAIGNNCTIMERKIPLYANLIRIGNNVHIASKVNFVTHDIIHSLINNLELGACSSSNEKINEKVGCIDIGNNVFIGTQSTILMNVKIGSNCIIGACTLVNKDIPDNSIAVGVPAKIIGKFSDFVEKRKKQSIYPHELKPINQICSKKLADFIWEKFNESRG